MKTQVSFLKDKERWYRVTTPSAMDEALEAVSDLYESFYVNGEDHTTTRDLVKLLVEAWDRMLG